MQLVLAGKQQFIDANGAPLVGGKVAFYAPGTTNPVSTYQDSGGTALNTNPVVLDSRGQAVIYCAVDVRQVVTDVNGLLVWDQVVQAITAGSSYSASGASPGAALIGFDSGSVADYFRAKSDRVVDSIAALRALNKTVFTHAFVTGYYAPHDGGGGHYQFDSIDTTSVDNGGTVIVAADGGRWKLQMNAPVSLKQFGAKGDGVTDDTAAIQAAVTAVSAYGGRLYAPAPKLSYRTTAPINIPNGLTIEGDGVRPYTSMSTTVANTMGEGSWFLFDHLGKGFNIGGATSPATVSGVKFKGIGTYRNQPTPNGAAAFTPIAADYDFYQSNADVFMDDVCLLNATKGIFVTNGNQGRLTANNVFGQPLNYGLVIDTAYDCCRITNVHFWPYWSEAAGVNTYTLTSGTAFLSARSDTCMYDNLFCYGYNIGFLVTQNANGTTTGQISNLNIDDCFNGLVLDSSVTGARLNISNVTIQGASPSSVIAGINGGANSGIVCSATNSNLNIKGIDFGFFGAYLVNVLGSGSIVRLSQVRGFTWNNLNVSTYYGFNVAAGATLLFTDRPEMTGGNGAAFFGGAGLYHSPLDAGQTSAVTDATGHLTISHAGGFPPTNIKTQFWNDTAQTAISVGSPAPTAAAFTLRFYNPNTATPMANAAVIVSWDLSV